MQGEFPSACFFSFLSMLTLIRHYVAFIRKSFPGQSELSWVLFNDEKVVKYEGIDDMKKTAYMYFFTRV